MLSPNPLPGQPLYGKLVDAFANGFGNGSSMGTYVLISGYGATLFADGKGLNFRDLVVLLFYGATYLANVLFTWFGEWYLGEQGFAVGSSSAMSSSAMDDRWNHGWYLLFLVWPCKGVLVLGEYCRVPGWALVAGCFAAELYCQCLATAAAGDAVTANTKSYNLTADAVRSAVIFAGEFAPTVGPAWPFSALFDGLGGPQAQFEPNNASKWGFAGIYMAGFHFGPTCQAWLRRQKAGLGSRRRQQALAGAALLGWAGLSLLLGAMPWVRTSSAGFPWIYDFTGQVVPVRLCGAQFWTPVYTMFRSGPDNGHALWIELLASWAVSWAGMVGLALLLWTAVAIWPNAPHLRLMGTTTLGTYVFQNYFLGLNNPLGLNYAYYGALASLGREYGGLAQILFMVGVAVLFQCSLGPVFDWLLRWPISRLQRMWILATPRVARYAHAVAQTTRKQCACCIDVVSVWTRRAATSLGAGTSSDAAGAATAGVCAP